MSALSQYTALSRRSIVNTMRQPVAIVPTLAFPLMFMAMSSAALERSIDLPGFPPVDSFLQFLIATTIVQGAMFGSVAAGADMASDIEGGFFERLIATPVSRTSILIGRLAGAAMIGLVQSILFFSVTFVFGMRPEGGLLGVALVAVVASILSAGVGSISVAFALRTGSTEAVQGSFPMLFALLFLSSAFFPRSLMSGWFKGVADANPLSHLIEGLRVQVIAGVDWHEFFVALGIAAAILVIGTSIANLALRGRLAERA